MSLRIKVKREFLCLFSLLLYHLSYTLNREAGIEPAAQSWQVRRKTHDGRNVSIYKCGNFLRKKIILAG